MDIKHILEMASTFCAVLVMVMLTAVSGEKYEKARQNLKEIPAEIPSDTKEVNLEYNKFTTIPKNSFVTLSKCRKLYIGNNEISSIEEGAFNGLGRLEELHMDGNKLEEISKEMWKGLKGLKALYLSSNDISVINSGAFSSLSKLGTLNMNMNSLTMLKSNMFQGLKNIKTLSIRNNEVEVVEPKTFYNIPIKIKSLSLDHNNIHKLPSNMFNMAKHPIKLDLDVSYNPLECSPDVCWLMGAVDEGWLSGTEMSQVVKGCDYITNHTSHCTLESLGAVSIATSLKISVAVVTTIAMCSYFK